MMCGTLRFWAVSDKITHDSSENNLEGCRLILLNETNWWNTNLKRVFKKGLGGRLQWQADKIFKWS